MSIHAADYEGKVEEVCPVEEFHRATCSLCGWTSEEFDSLDWKSAEEAAVDHIEEHHEDDEEEDDDDS